MIYKSSGRGSRGRVVLFMALAAIVLTAAWGLTSLLAQGSASREQDSQAVIEPIVTEPVNVERVEVSTWQQSADLVRSHVNGVLVNGRPLARVADTYSVDLRVIHNEEFRNTSFPVQLPEEEWRRRLSPEQFRIIRESGTERAFTSPLDKIYEPGIYYSRATGQPLFSSEDKYDSRTGWPSFTKPISPDALAYFYEQSFFSRNIEVVDSLSGAHLGHVFRDGPAPTNQRYCINGEALIFVPEGGDPPELLIPGL
ncbi:peptide-methionine (R)-S-oxide reductase MsrB [Spirochaeta dissipatitropha]